MEKTKGKATDLDIEIGARLQALRLIHCFSQEKLSQAIGLTFQQIQKYEKGTNRISVSRLVDISKVLKVPITCFIDEKENSSMPNYPGIQNIQEGKLLRAYRNLPTKVKASVVDFLAYASKLS